MDIDKDGYLYFATTLNSGDTIIESIGELDCWLVKIDREGNVLV